MLHVASPESPQPERARKDWIIPAAALALLLLLLLWFLWPPRLQGRLGALADGAHGLVFGTRGAALAGTLGGATGEEPASDTASTRDVSPATEPTPASPPEVAASESLPTEDRPLGIPELDHPDEREPSDPLQPGAAGRDPPDARLGNDPQAPGTEAAALARRTTNGPADLRTNRFPRPAEADRPAGTTTPVIPNSQVAFLADEFGQRLRQAGAQSGDVQISLLWNNVNDLDLHCVDPNGERIYFHHRRSRSGGQLDVDMNAMAPLTEQPVENIYWPSRGAPPGPYKVFVHHYSHHGGRDPTAFVVRVVVQGRATQFTGSLSSGDPERLVHQFTLGPGAAGAPGGRPPRP